MRKNFPVCDEAESRRGRRRRLFARASKKGEALPLIRRHSPLVFVPVKIQGRTYGPVSPRRKSAERERTPSRRLDSPSKEARRRHGVSLGRATPREGVKAKEEERRQAAKKGEKTNGRRGEGLSLHIHKGRKA